MSFLDMQNRVLNLLGVESVTNSGVTLVEVRSFLNSAGAEVAASIEDLLTYCEYDCTAYAGVPADIADSQRYSLPEHYLTAKQLLLSRDDPATNTWERLIHLNLEEWERVTYGRVLNTGVPEYYKIERWATSTSNDPQIPGDIWLFPLPDDTYPFRLYYYQRPTELATANADDNAKVMELPGHWHMVVCLRAAEMLAVKIKDYELSRLLEGKYWNALMEAKGQAMRPQRDRATAMVRDVMGYTDIVD